MAKDEKKEEGGKAVKVGAHVAHKNIYAALSAFQGELKPFARSGKVSFDKKNGSGKVEFTYTPLDEIMKAVYPLLAKHGLSFMHKIVKEGTKDAVVAIVTHESYEETSEVSLEEKREGTGQERVTLTTSTVKTKNQVTSGPIIIAQGGSDMKDTGAAITYARRYSLTMALGIASEEDKDAELLEQSAKNAQGFAYTRAKKGIEDAKDEKALDKALNILNQDLENVTKGKAGALGLTAESYEELIAYGETARKRIKDGLNADGSEKKDKKEE